MSAADIIPNASSESIENNIIKQTIATLQDCESLSLFINSAYRGESAHQGWTNENWLLGGQRIDAQMLADIINDQTNVILMFSEPIEGTLIGCVRVQHNSAAKSAHLGLLTVRPNLQKRGYGKLILSAAENYAVNNWNVEHINMNVIIHRSELIAYYKRRGYADTGRREPFPMHEIRYGLPKRTDLEFCVIEKSVKKT